MEKAKTNLFEYKETSTFPLDSISVTHPNISQMKYGEVGIIKQVIEYIANTYGEHYVGKDNIQVFDILLANSIASDFYQANAAKYVLRYGKKSGYNKNDLLKAIHYLILLAALDTKEK